MRPGAAGLIQRLASMSADGSPNFVGAITSSLITAG
jgi:hypothetical protein